MQTRIVPPSGRRTRPDWNHRIHDAPPHLAPQRPGPGPKRGPVGMQEGELAPGMACNAPPALVHKPVMERAQQHQVVEIGGSALCPMHEMVGVSPAGSFASGEAASLVTVPHLARKPWRHPSRGAPHTHTIHRQLHPGVATQTPGRLDIQKGATFDLGATGAGDKIGSTNVHHQGGPIGVGVGGQAGRGDLDKSVGATRRVRLENTGHRVAGRPFSGSLQSASYQGAVVVGQPPGNAKPAAAPFPPPAQGSLFSVRDRFAGCTGAARRSLELRHRS
jgi:hypothetical protein